MFYDLHEVLPDIVCLDAFSVEEDGGFDFFAFARDGSNVSIQGFGDDSWEATVVIHGLDGAMITYLVVGKTAGMSLWAIAGMAAGLFFLARKERSRKRSRGREHVLG